MDSPMFFCCLIVWFFLQPITELQEEELDETAAYVEVSDEARARLAHINNIIGDYICMLCKVL